MSREVEDLNRRLLRARDGMDRAYAERLDFYLNKLGLEGARDIGQGPFRWLTVRCPDDPSVEMLLEEPGPPVHDEASAEQLRELISIGNGIRILQPKKIAQKATA